MTCRRVLPVLPCLLLLAVSTTAESRRFTDSSGSYAVEAEVAGWTDTTVALRRIDGQEIEIPLSQLSPADQAFVREHPKSMASSTTPVAAPLEQVEPPEVVHELARADEQAVHWLDVCCRDSSGEARRYQIFLFFDARAKADELRLKWFLGDEYSAGSVGSVAVDESGEVPTDPETVGNIFSAAMNLCHVKQGHELSPNIEAERLKAVLRSKTPGAGDHRELPAQMIVFMETMTSRLLDSRPDKVWRERQFQNTFLLALPALNQTTIEAAATLLAMRQSHQDNGLEAIDLWNVAKVSPALSKKLLVFQAFVEDRNIPYRDVAYFQRIEDAKWKEHLVTLKQVQGAIKFWDFVDTVYSVYTEERSLHLNSPGVNRAADWLDETSPMVGGGLRSAADEIRTVQSRLIDVGLTLAGDELVSEANSWAELVALNRLSQLAVRIGADPVKFKFVFAIGTTVGLAVAWEAFDIDGMAQALELCEACAKIEETTDVVYNARRSQSDNWTPTSPPEADDLAALIWLQRLHDAAGAVFYSSLAGVLSNKDNLLVSLQYVQWEEGRVVYNSDYADQLRLMTSHGVSILDYVNHIVPRSSDSTDVYEHLMKAYRLASPAPYEVVDIGAVPKSFEGPDLNNRGEVLTGENRIWTPNGVTSVRAQKLSVSAYVAKALNDQGQTCGDGGDGETPLRMGRDKYHLRRAYYCANQRAVSIRISRDNTGHAMAINNHGGVVGYSGANRNPRQPTPAVWKGFLWNSGKSTMLGTLGGKGTWPVDVNDQEQVTGSSQVRSEGRHAFFWEDGNMTDLGTLGGKDSWGDGINAKGHVVGWSETADGAKRAFLHDNQGMRDLETLGGRDSQAYAVNGKDEVVGSSRDESGLNHAFRWYSGQMVDLNDLISEQSQDWVLETAYDINESGQIAGIGKLNGQSRYFLLNPPGYTPPSGSLTSDSSKLASGDSSTADPTAPRLKESDRLYPFRDGPRVGYLDANGAVVIDPRFIGAKDFSEGLGRVNTGTPRTSSRVDGNLLFSEEPQWGYVDGAGKTVIEPKFLAASDFVDGVAVVVIQKGGWLPGEVYVGKVEGHHERVRNRVAPAVHAVIDTSGAVLHEQEQVFNFDPIGEWIPAWVFSDGLARRWLRRRVDQGGRPHFEESNQFIDKVGNVVVRCDYPKAGEFHEGLARVQTHASRVPRTTTILPARWGYIDNSGSPIIAPRFADAGDFHEGLAAVQVFKKAESGPVAEIGAQWGFIDAKGNLVISPQFDEVEAFSEGVAAVCVRDRWSFIDKTGQTALEIDGVKPGNFSEGLASVGRSHEAAFVDISGQRVIELAFDQASPFRGGLARIVRDGKLAYIDAAGDFIWAEDPAVFGLDADPAAVLAGSFVVQVQPEHDVTVTIYRDDDFTKYENEEELLQGKTPLATMRINNPQGMCRFQGITPPFLLRISHPDCEPHWKRITSIESPYRRTLAPKSPMP